MNEAHGLRAAAIRLLVTQAALPAWLTVIFTTTFDGLDKAEGAAAGC